MSRATSLESIKKHFISSLDSNKNIIDTITKLTKVRHKKDEFCIHPKVAEKIMGQIFVGICASWETFLEDTFIRNMNHAKGPTYSPVPIKPRLRNISECYDIINQSTNSMDLQYLNIWTDNNKLVNRAKIYFQNGDPYSLLTASKKYYSFFNASKVIRNYSAHDSNKALANFKTLCVPIINSTSRAYSPGSILLRTDACKEWFEGFNFFTALGTTGTKVKTMAAFIKGYEELADLIVK